MFILSGGGKLNYIGSKNWIEQQMEKSNTLQVIKKFINNMLKNLKFKKNIVCVLGCVICIVFRLVGQR